MSVDGKRTGPLNLILCSDGTGNKGGATPDSNVFKTYNAVNIHTEGNQPEQRTFYDVGVGTSDFALWKSVSSAVGSGFGQNVKDLYRFLARNYDPDPKRATKIYLFGFSRGAATVRAFTGFLHTCGLVDGRGLTAERLDACIEVEFARYKGARAYDLNAEPLERMHGRVPIHFIGVWDTVSALGAPKWGKPTGRLSQMMKWTCNRLDDIANTRRHHRSYQYGLNRDGDGNDIKHAYQALAIDDERTSFRPMVWDERALSEGGVVEQVWFAGMHSNVGGGYAREGLANVALEWMIERARYHGLLFNESALYEIHNSSNSHGLMQDSRAGAAKLFRYHPRNIAELCKDKLVGDPGAEGSPGLPRIHESVIKRMEDRVGDYAPGYLPPRFNVVGTTLQRARPIGREIRVEVEPVDETSSDTGASAPASAWHTATQQLKMDIDERKRVYSVMLFTVLVALVSAFYLWISPPEEMTRSGVFGHLADTADYLTPELLSGLVEVAVVHHPIIVTAAALAGILGWRYRQRVVKRMEHQREELRTILLEKTRVAGVHSGENAGGVA